MDNAGHTLRGTDKHNYAPVIRDLNVERQNSCCWCCSSYKNLCCAMTVFLVTYFLFFLFIPNGQVAYDAIEAPTSAQVMDIYTNMGPHEMLINSTMCMPAQPQVSPYIFKEMVIFNPCEQEKLSSSCCSGAVCDATRFQACKKSDSENGEEVCKYTGMACYTPTEYEVIHNGDDDGDAPDKEDWPFFIFIMIFMFAVCFGKNKDAVNRFANRARRKWDSGKNSNADHAHTYQMVDFVGDDYNYNGLTTSGRSSSTSASTISNELDNATYNDAYWKEIEAKW